MKKFTNLFLLSLLSFISLSSCSTMPYETRTIDGKKTITLVSPKIKKLIVPDGIEVIGEGCTSSKENELTTVSLPNTVTTIGKNAFFGCLKLESINLPESLTSIGPRAFGDTIRLETINWPSSLDTINTSLFQYSGLKSFAFPSTLKYIKHSAFMGCYNLEEVILPEGFIEFEDYAFDQCNNVKKWVLPSSLISIPYFFFVGLNCSSTFYYQGSREKFDSIFDGELLDNHTLYVKDANNEYVRYE